jgi:flagellar motility protein MotE (MotC chaperone)
MTIFFLTTIFGILLVATIILFDYVGIINLKDKLSENVKKNVLVQSYLKKANLNLMPEEMRIKEWLERQADAYNNQKEILKKMESNINKEREKFLVLQKEIFDLSVEVNKRNDELEKNIKEFDEKQKQYLKEEETIDKTVKIYEKMDAETASKVIIKLPHEMQLKIFLKMRDKTAAEILNFYQPEVAANIIKLTNND